MKQKQKLKNKEQKQLVQIDQEPLNEKVKQLQLMEEIIKIQDKNEKKVFQGNKEQKKTEKDSVLIKRKRLSQNWEKFLDKQKQIDSNQREVLKIKKKDDQNQYQSLAPTNSYKGETPVVALDCEMVLCADKYGGNRHELARLSIVNYNGHSLFDEFIKPKSHITNYLTEVSGIKFELIKDKQNLDFHLQKIKSILDGKKVVGHTLESDFKVLPIKINQSMIRDIKSFKKFKNGTNVQSLKKLALKYLNIQIQEGQHSSIDDARAALYLYRKYEKEIEQQYKNQNYKQVKNQVLKDIKNGEVNYL